MRNKRWVWPAAAVWVGLASPLPVSGQEGTGTGGSATGDGGTEGVWGWREIKSKVDLGAPAVRVALAEAEAAEAMRQNAGVWSNPELGLEVVGFGGSMPWLGPEETSLTVKQAFPLAGRLGQERAVAGATVQKAKAEAAEVADSLRLRVFLKFVEALAAAQRRELENERLVLSQRAMQLLDARIQAGAMPEAERSRSEATFALAELAVVQAQRQAAAALRGLAASWGGKPNEVAAVSGDLGTLPVPDSLAELTGFVGQAPGYQAVLAEEEVWAQQVHLEEAVAVPDLSLSAGGGWFGGFAEFGLVLGVEWAMPLFDRNVARIDEGRARQRQARHRVTAWESGWMEQLVEAHGVYELNFERQAILAGKVLPALEAALAAVERGFQNGKHTTLDLLESQQALLEARVELLEARKSAWDAVLTLDYLTGRLGSREWGGAK